MIYNVKLIEAFFNIVIAWEILNQSGWLSEIH